MKHQRRSAHDQLASHRVFKPHGQRATAVIDKITCEYPSSLLPSIVACTVVKFFNGRKLVDTFEKHDNKKHSKLKSAKAPKIMSSPRAFAIAPQYKNTWMKIIAVVKHVANKRPITRAYVNC